MKLFTINPDTQELDLNREWIFLVPELKLLIDRDRGSEGDYRGDKKRRARRELTFIYFMEDFSSPLREWDPDKRREESLRCAGLLEKEIDDKIKAAQTFYAGYLRKASRSLRTLDALHKGMDALDKWFEEIDFDKVDSLKRAKYTAKEYMDNVKNLPKMNAAIKEYERMVEEELKENTGIRGKNTLGLMEGQRRQGWEEGGPPTDDVHSKARETIDL